MNCENCTNCPVMKIEEKLRWVYDWSQKESTAFPIFGNCGKKDFIMFENKDKNLICFARALYRNINWSEVKKVYLRYQEMLDKEFENAKSGIDSQANV